MLDRLEVVSPFGEVQLRIGGLEPTSNLGPWLKDGQKFYVWDEDTADYIPLDIADSIAPYVTAINATIATLATTASVTAAIDAAIAAIPTPETTSVHFSANQTSGMSSGSLTDSDSEVIVLWNSPEVDTNSGFSSAKYTIPTTGFYNVTVCVHTQVTSGSGTAYGITGQFCKNGVGVRAFSPGISLGGSTIFEINYQGAFVAGDELSMKVNFAVTGGPATLEVVGNNTRLSGFLVP
jgi:hypothetical protein